MMKISHYLMWSNTITGVENCPSKMRGGKAGVTWAEIGFDI
ncbi:hypothetical protein ACQKMD_16665 [Viridibacillus sp. NPDC096237]